MTKSYIIKGINIQELERIYDKAHAWFFAYPTEGISLTDLSINLRVSKKTAKIIVSSLEKEGFLQKKVLGKIWQITANQQHPYFMTRRIPFNLRLIYESGIIEWVTENIPNFLSITLFGSYRKGEDMPLSDIDIAIEIIGDEPMKIIKRTIPELGYRKNIPVNFHIFSRNHVDLNLFNNIANGIVLQGFLEVHP